MIAIHGANHKSLIDT